jgi:hypothetical protein
VLLQFAAVPDGLHGHERLEFGGLVRVIHVAVLFLSRSDRASFFTLGGSAVSKRGESSAHSDIVIRSW